MNEPFSSGGVEPKRVWTESTQIEPKELIVPTKSADSSDDIPTLPDLDDFQDILEKEVSRPPVASDLKDKETVTTLAEVGEGLSGSVEGIDGVIEVLKSYLPQSEPDSDDSVWTIESLVTQLLEEEQQS